MKQLLVIGETIFAVGRFVDDGENIRSYTPVGAADAVYPKHVIDGWQIVDADVPDDFRCSDYLWQGEVVKKPPVFVPPTVQEYTDAVQSHLDAAAKAKNYDNIVSACSYAGAPNQFQAEGQAFLTWRADCWNKCYSIQADVANGLRTAPTIDALIAELPALVLP